MPLVDVASICNATGVRYFELCTSDYSNRSGCCLGLTQMIRAAAIAIVLVAIAGDILLVSVAEPETSAQLPGVLLARRRQG